MLVKEKSEICSAALVAALSISRREKLEKK